jgi:hypothetical protein
MRRLMLVSLLVAAPMFALGGTSAAASGWCGYGYGYGGYRYLAPRAYGYSYYRPAYFYRPYYRPRFAYGAFYRPRFAYGGFYRSRGFGWRGGRRW